MGVSDSRNDMSGVSEAVLMKKLWRLEMLFFELRKAKREEMAEVGRVPKGSRATSQSCKISRTDSDGRCSGTLTQVRVVDNPNQLQSIIIPGRLYNPIQFKSIIILFIFITSSILTILSPNGAKRA